MKEPCIIVEKRGQWFAVYIETGDDLMPTQVTLMDDQIEARAAANIMAHASGMTIEDRT